MSMPWGVSGQCFYVKIGMDTVDVSFSRHVWDRLGAIIVSQQAQSAWR